MTQEHAFKAAELCLKAQAAAVAVRSGEAPPEQALSASKGPALSISASSIQASIKRVEWVRGD